MTPARTQSGFTLVEAVVVLTVAAVLASIGASAFVDSLVAARRAEDRAAFARDARLALARFARDVRSIPVRDGAPDIVRAEVDELEFVDADGVRIVWSLREGELRRGDHRACGVAGGDFAFLDRDGRPARTISRIVRVGLRLSVGDPPVAGTCDIAIRAALPGIAAWSEPEALP